MPYPNCINSRSFIQYYIKPKAPIIIEYNSNSNSLNNGPS